MEKCEFVLEDLYDTLTIEFSIYHDLIGNEMLNIFFNNHGHLWSTFDPIGILAEYDDNEMDLVLLDLDFFFGQYGIEITIAGNKNDYKYLPFEEARKYVQKLHLKNTDEWLLYITDETEGLKSKPNQIPKYPWEIYPKEWIDMEDWLGIEKNLNDFLNNLEFTSNYFDEYKQELPLYKHEISEKKLNQYIAQSNTIKDDRIHATVTKLDFKNVSPEMIANVLNSHNTFSKYHKQLLSNPTISLEAKLKYILTSKKRKVQKILNFIEYLDIDNSEIEQVKKIINIFEQAATTTQYTPYVNNIEESRKIVRVLKMKLSTMVISKDSKISNTV